MSDDPGKKISSDDNSIEQFRRFIEPLRQLIIDWGATISPIVLSVGALFAFFGIPKDIATLVAWVAVIAAATAAAFFLWRIKARNRATQQLPQTELSGATARAAFRGLAAFQVGDNLPGEQRRREARTIFTHMYDDSFRFGILSGDTGAGKSSLARAELTKLFSEAGFQSCCSTKPETALCKERS